MKESEKCPVCGAELKAGTPCAACLLGVGLESAGAEDAAKTSAWTPPGIDQLAARFPELDLLELLGRGGMGAVYKARQANLDRLVAIKILPPEVGGNPAFATRFTREAKALAKLNHPNIVTIHDFGERDGLYFFMMEYVDGVNLRQLLDTGRVSAREALAIVPQICDALQCAHDQGIVHRDIKPENILMDRQGRVKIADFGLVKLIEESEKTSGGRGGEEPGPAAVHTLAAVGTPDYMAPEQIEHPGEVDHRADIYALGVVFYQMLTGELPDKELIPPSRRAVEIDIRLDEIVLQALEKDPVRRYSQVSIIKTRLENVGTTSDPKQEKVSPPLPPISQKRRPWIWMSAFLVLHLLAGMGVIVFFGYVIPRFQVMFNDMAVSLPFLAIVSLNLGQIFRHWGILLFPLFLLFDAGFCLLLTFGRLRKLLILWGILVLVLLAAILGTTGFSVFTVQHQLTEDIGTSQLETDTWALRQNRKLANQPNKLRSLPVAQVVGLVSDPAFNPEELMMVEEQERQMKVTRVNPISLVIASLFVVVLGIPLTIAAIIWIVLGAKKGCAWGRSALFLATGLPFFDLLVVSLPFLYLVRPAGGGSRLNFLAILSGLFVALELCALFLGFFARKTKSGKAAMVISGILLSLILALLVVKLPM